MAVVSKALHILWKKLMSISYALGADYGPRFWLRGGNIVLETGEGTVLSLFFGRAERPPR